MKTCPNCGTILDDSAAFCAGCGTAVPKADTPAPEPQAELPVCTGCGAPVDKDDAFCQSCGTPVGITISQIMGLPTPAAAAVRTAGEKGTAKLKISGRLMIAAAAVVVIAIAIACVFLFSPSKRAQLLYLKDNEINMTGLNKIEPFQLTDDLYDGGTFDGYLNSYINISDDGKYMFYPEDMSGSDATMDLYYINLKANNAKESSAVKIDSGVSNYKISLTGTKVFYLKKDRLYFFNLKDKVKIDSDVSDYYISDDGLKLAYLTGDNDLYMKDMKSGDAEKIDSDAVMQHVTPDLEKVYYIKNSNLYLKEDGKDKTKIDGDVTNIPLVYESGALYYIKSTTQTVPLSDYVSDDMTADAVMEEPDYDDFIKENSTGYKYFDNGAYNDAWDAYDEKQERDDLRSDLKSYTYTVNKASLYYYDGNTSVKVTDNYNAYMTGSWEKAILVYSKYSSADIPKLKLSKMTSYYDVQRALDTAFHNGFDKCIAIGAKETEIDQESAETFRINKAGTKLFFIEGNASSDSFDLYTLAITGDTVGALELYDEDVYEDYLVVSYSDAVVYFKDVDSDNYCGDFFISKNNVDTDVYTYNVRLTGGDKTKLIYLADVDDDDYIGTLKMYDGKKAVKISDDVRSYLVDDKGTMAYITNYDTDDSVGDAYLYNGSKPQLIDDEVSYLLMIG